MASFNRQFAVKIVLFVLWGVCIAQNGNETISDRDSSDSENGDEKSPTEKGMEPLYLMTNTFLDIVHPPSKALVNTVLGISVADLVNSNSLDINAEWKDYTMHYIGFVICIAVGVLYIIIMPIVGCCFCICRCIGNCGAKSHKNPEKGSQRYKRVCCGIFLLLFNTLMLAGMVCAFVTNELLRAQTSQSDEGVLSKTQQKISSVNQFKNSVLMELNNEAVVKFQGKLDQIIQGLEGAPEKARKNISELTNADDIIKNAESLVSSVVSINESLMQVQDLTDSLQLDMVSLTSSLNAAKVGALNSLNRPECSIQSCEDAKSQVNQLGVNPDYTQVEEVDEQLNRIKATLDQNLAGLVEEGRTEFEDISEMVLTDTQTQIEEVKEKKDEVIANVKAEVAKLIKEVDQMIPLNDTSESIEAVKKDAETYGNYRYYAGIGLSSILLLIILLYYLGLCFGACGEAPGDDNSCCNRGIGATVLMVGVAFTFLFCWLLMLVVLLVFLAGGITYTEVCRPLVKLDNTTLSIAQPLFEKLGLNFSIEVVIRDCEDNQGIYRSFQLDQFFDLGEVLDIQKYEVREKLDELVASVDVSGLATVEVISQDTKNRLTELKDASLDNINFESYRQQLDKALVSPDLDPIITQLNELAAVLTNPYQAEIAGHASSLESLKNGIMAGMKSNINKLKGALNTLENEFVKVKGSVTFSVKVDNLITSLETVQLKIRTEGQAMVKSFIKDYGDTVYSDMEYYIGDRKIYIERDLGRCRPLYNLLVDTINIACTDFLSPFNGFWFSIGWCIFFFVPSIIFAVGLVSLYRRTDEYDDADYRSFDEAKKGRKNAQHNGSGRQNPGYDDRSGRSGGYPDGREQRHREDHRDDNNRGGYGGGYPQGYDSGGGYDHRGGSSPSHPPHYYNNRHQHY